MAYLLPLTLKVTRVDPPVPPETTATVYYDILDAAGAPFDEGKRFVTKPTDITEVMKYTVDRATAALMASGKVVLTPEARAGLELALSPKKSPLDQVITAPGIPSESGVKEKR